MKRILLDQGWQYLESGLQNPLLVNFLQGWKHTDLPHDYSVEKPRSPSAPAGPDEGYCQGAGLYYKKTFRVYSPGNQRFWLEFEGVAGATEVWVNKRFLCKHQNPYTSFWEEVTTYLQEGENEILLHTDSRAKPNSRWYQGSGIYRHVWLHQGQQVCVRPHTVQVQTAITGPDTAQVEVAGQMTGVAEVTARLRTAEGAVAAQAAGRAAGVFHFTLTVENPRLWDVDDPYRYTLEITADSGIEVDSYQEKVGLRTVAVNPGQGFLLNGNPLKLRGGCVHHDLGPLGAAEYDAADRRRVRILKENGFNALRLAHNPFGPSMLEACDELGMLVVEEAFDEWVLGRTSFGLHLTFEDRWERDLEDMIRRDYNHPCIVMWSTGNEVEERDGTADGYRWSARLAEKVRALDPTRPVSATACALFVEYGNRPPKGTTGNQALNMAYDNFASGTDLWGDATEAYFAPLDVAGYNYKVARYAFDGEKFPQRVIYGSESYPRAALLSWQGVEENSHVIGDFVWTAWDYLGEVGIGRWEVSDSPRPANPGWPWLAASCADFDLIGQKRPQSYYRDLVWHRAAGPRLFCLPPDLVGKNLARLSWAWLPVERNYAWPGREGRPVEVHVYADADEVELIQNGRSAGKKPCTVDEEYTAVFTLPYLPGTLEAVAYRNRAEAGRDLLSTAGPMSGIELKAHTERGADGRELAFVLLQAVDDAGRPVYAADAVAEAQVQGGRLLAFGSADPRPEDAAPFRGTKRPLYHGQALAVVEKSGPEIACTLAVRAGEASAEISL